MKQVGTGFLATTDGKRAAVRPMSAYAWFGRELWLATFLKSVKVADLSKHPRAELAFVAADFCNARIAGACRLSVRPEDKRNLFAAYAWMGQYFGSATNPDWGVLRLKPTRILWMGKDMKIVEVKLPS